MLPIILAACASRGPLLSSHAVSKLVPGPISTLDKALSLRGGANIGRLDADMFVNVMLVVGALYGLELSIPALNATKKYVGGPDHPFRAWLGTFIWLLSGVLAVAKWSWGVPPLEILKIGLLTHLTSFILYAYQHHATREIKTPQALYVLGLMIALGSYVAYV